MKNFSNHFGKRLPAALLFMLFAAPLSRGAITMVSIFNDDMVLQQNTNTAVWGTGVVGETITVELQPNSGGEALQTQTAVVDGSGNWSLALAPVAGGFTEYQLVVSGTASTGRTISNVLFGEVWLLGGQSNMQRSYHSFKADYGIDTVPGQSDADDYGGGKIRFFKQTTIHATEDPAADVDNGGWVNLSAVNAEYTSVVGWLFAKELSDTLGVPIAYIQAFQGGTSAKFWIRRDYLEASPCAEDFSTVWNPDKEPIWSQPCGLYNGQVHPLIPFTIRGMLWYQGESDSQYGKYSLLMKTLIDSWRAEWGYDFPFYYVQLPAYRNLPSGNPWDDLTGKVWAYAREQQTLNLTNAPCTEMAVTIDTGEYLNIHPINKAPVSHRLALIALAKQYGETSLVYRSPRFTGASVSGTNLICAFNVFNSSLTGTTVDGFELAGADGVYYRARATCVDDTVVVNSPWVNSPVDVRYLWANWPSPDTNNPVAIDLICNADGLPASPFRTDTRPFVNEAPSNSAINQDWCWEFEEGIGAGVAANVSSGPVGTLSGDVVWTNAGHRGGALYFPGNTNGHVEMPALDFGDDFTVAAWVKTESMTGVEPNPEQQVLQGLVANRDGGNTDGFTLFLNNHWGTVYDGSVAVGTGNGLTGSSQAVVTPQHVVSTNTWHHICAVIDRSGRYAVIYVDGIQEATSAIAGDFTVNRDWKIGSLYSGKFPFKGFIDELCLFDHKLSAVEAGQLAGRLTANGTPVAWLSGYDLTVDTTDPDHDGFLSWQEYIAGTNPTSGLSHFLADITNSALTWSTVSNRLYSIDWSTNLTAGFTLLTNGLRNSPFTLPASASYACFRLRVAVAD
jgi:hypothetical protein